MGREAAGEQGCCLTHFLLDLLRGQSEQWDCQGEELVLSFANILYFLCSFLIKK